MVICILRKMCIHHINSFNIIILITQTLRTGELNNYPNKKNTFFAIHEYYAVASCHNVVIIIKNTALSIRKDHITIRDRQIGLL